MKNNSSNTTNENTNQEMIASRIKDLAKEKGYSFQRLEDLTGISRATIGRYMNGESRIPTDKIVIIAKALHTRPEYILGLTPYKTANEERIARNIEAMKMSLENNGVRETTPQELYLKEVLRFVEENDVSVEELKDMYKYLMFKVNNR